MVKQDDTREDIREETEDVEESEDLEDEETEDDDSEEVEKLKEQLAEAEAKAKKAENTLRRVNSKKKKTAKHINNSEKNVGDPELEDKISRLELKQDGLTEEQVDFVMEMGGPEMVKKYPALQKALEEVKEQAESEKASQVKSSKKSGSKTEVSLEDMKGMSHEELEKVLPHKQ